MMNKQIQNSSQITCSENSFYISCPLISDLFSRKNRKNEEWLSVNIFTVPLFTSILIFLCFNLLSFFSPWNVFLLSIIIIDYSCVEVNAKRTHLGVPDFLKEFGNSFKAVMSKCKDIGGQTQNNRTNKYMQTQIKLNLKSVEKVEGSKVFWAANKRNWILQQNKAFGQNISSLQ